VLVTLRASQKEDEDDAEDFDSDYEEETYHLAPEELSKAPVFVPVGLRSPEPVSAQIEETMEEVVCVLFCFFNFWHFHPFNGWLFLLLDLLESEEFFL
jgi:hypothetical protein